MDGVAENRERRPSGFERHLQTAMTTLLVMLVGAALAKGSEAIETLTRLDERVSVLSENMAQLDETKLHVQGLEIRVQVLERQLGGRDDR